MDKPKIYLSSPHMGEEELLNVQEAFVTNWISPTDLLLANLKMI